MAVVALIAAGAAQAAPPTGLTLSQHEDVVKASWTLPTATAVAGVLEFSPTATIAADGYFADFDAFYYPIDDAVATFETPPGDVPPGTYYVHVSSYEPLVCDPGVRRWVRRVLHTARSDDRHPLLAAAAPTAASASSTTAPAGGRGDVLLEPGGRIEPEGGQPDGQGDDAGDRHHHRVGDGQRSEGVEGLQALERHRERDCRAGGDSQGQAGKEDAEGRQEGDQAPQEAKGESDHHRQGREGKYEVRAAFGEAEVAVRAT